MKPFTAKVKSILHLTHDVLQIVTEKPAQLKFTPGQATEISINKDGWQNC
jgi:ferredoxin-NADP reductase